MRQTKNFLERPRNSGGGHRSSETVLEERISAFFFCLQKKLKTLDLPLQLQSLVIIFLTMKKAKRIHRSQDEPFKLKTLYQLSSMVVVASWQRFVFAANANDELIKKKLNGAGPPDS